MRLPHSLRSLGWYVVCLTLLFSGVTPALAQANTFVDGVNVAGQTHVVRYTQNQADQVARIETALQTVLPVYEKYWNPPQAGAGPRAMEFRLFVDVGVPNPAAGEDLSSASLQTVAVPVPSAPAPWTGQSESTRTSVCTIQLFNTPTLYTLPGVLEFEVALDAAHCYLLHYAPTNSPAPDWWFKGLSEWMAVQAYRPPPSVLMKLQKEYADNYNQNLTSASEEALYFWEFMLGERAPATLRTSLPDVVNTLKTLPTTITFFTPDLFYSYAPVVADNGLLWQPTPDDLAQDKQVAFFPDDVELDLEENSIVIDKVSLPALQAGEGVQISAEDFADNGVLAGVATNAGALVPLTEGTPIQLCDSSLTSLTIVAGRGPLSAPADATAQFAKVESCTPPTPPAQTGVLPGCVLGTWDLSFPFMQQRAQPAGGTYQMTFNPDGTYSLRAQNYTLTLPGSPGSSVMSFVITGNSRLEPDASIANRYNPTQWTFNVQPGVSVVITTSDGQQYDLSQDYADLVKAVAAPPDYLTCDQNSADNPGVNYFVNLQGAEVAWRLTRAR